MRIRLTGKLPSRAFKLFRSLKTRLRSGAVRWFSACSQSTRGAIIIVRTAVFRFPPIAADG
jgi:hypothetical protein